MAKSKKEKSNHYVDNKLFLEEMIKFRESVIQAKEKDLPRPIVPNYIGDCLFKIASHLARKPNFANYSFKEDMIMDGVENSLLYIDNFNPEKSSNPFAYFTQIIYYAFLRRIQKEKKQLYVKYKSMENEIINAVIVDDSGIAQSAIGSGVHDDYSEQFIGEFIESFEENKRKKVKQRKAKGLETLIDNDEDVESDEDSLNN
jgi:DNA-directed RNA polymerase specialized sigma24 family protein